jgi:hypothetical protein
MNGAEWLVLVIWPAWCLIILGPVYLFLQLDKRAERRDRASGFYDYIGRKSP